MPTLTLDHLEDIALDSEADYAKNLHALQYLPHGLAVLAGEVRGQEIDAARAGMAFAFGGSDPAIPFLACCFSWFSVSLVNYLRLVALVDLWRSRSWTSQDIANPANHKIVSVHCAAYAKRVAPDIVAWRHKIAAHFAATQPKAGDSLATLEATVMNPIVFERPYYWVSALQWCTESGVSSLPRWALTQVFENLAPRLWPHWSLAPVPEQGALRDDQQSGDSGA